MKNLCKLSIYRGFLEKLRSEADSNRCRRFCRPVTKPLIHRTLFAVCCLLWPHNCGANVQKNIKSPKLMHKFRAFSQNLLTLHLPKAHLSPKTYRKKLCDMLMSCGLASRRPYCQGCEHLRSWIYNF